MGFCIQTYSCAFFLGLWLWLGYLLCICVKQPGLGLDLDLGCSDTRTIEVEVFIYVCNQLNNLKREKDIMSRGLLSLFIYDCVCE